MRIKFWNWAVKFATRKMTAEEKIGFMANQLCEALTSNGYSFKVRDDSGFGHVNLWVHNFGTDDARLAVSRTGVFEVLTEPTFKKL